MLLLFFAAIAGNAQTLRPSLQKLPFIRVDTTMKDGRYMALKGSLPTDTTVDRFRKPPVNRIPDYGMPNAIKVPLPPDIYEGNNGKGQDIYRSQLDNMAILKPDSTFGGSMPNGFRMQPNLNKNSGTIYGNRSIPAPDTWTAPKKTPSAPARPQQ